MRISRLCLLTVLLVPTVFVSVLPETSAVLNRVSALTLNGGENQLRFAVIDATGGFAYFGTLTSPGIVVKVRLSDFSRVGNLTLNTGENEISTGVIDTVGGFAYFGTNTDPGIVVRVRLSDFTLQGALTLDSGEAHLHSAVIDAGTGYAYFGTGAGPTPGIVVKIRLSDFTRVGSLILNSGENRLFAAVIDTAGGYAYFGTNTSPGIVVKIRLSDFTRVSALTFNTGEANLEYGAAIDSGAGYAYFSTYTVPGIVVKVRLSDFTRVGNLTLNAGENNLSQAVIDTVGHFAYFGTATTPGIVVKVRLTNFTRVENLTLNSGEINVSSSVIDVAAGYAYFGTFTAPGVVVKVQVASVPSAPGNLKATGIPGGISLNWSPPASTGDHPVRNYKLYRATTSGGEIPVSTLGNVTSYVDSSLTPGTTYYYKISALNDLGESPLSAESSATATPTVPTAPLSLQATAGNAKITLVWSVPASNGGSAVTGYKIYRGVSSGGESLLTGVGGNVLTFLDTGLTNGQTYFYYVRAYNSAGEGPPATEVSATPTTSVTALPTIPILLASLMVATVIATSVRLRRPVRLSPNPKVTSGV